MHLMCMMEELMPSIGTSVPSPSVLAVVISQQDSTLQQVGKLYSDYSHTSSPVVDFNTPLDFCEESLLVSKTHLISISDDGNIWNWLLTAEGPEDAQKDSKNSGTAGEGSEVSVIETNSTTVVSSTDEQEVDALHPPDEANNIGSSPAARSSTVSLEEMSFKVEDFSQISTPNFLSFGLDNA